MTDLLSEVEYGRILGSFTAVAEDFGGTVAPDAIPLSGRVTFVPSISNVSYINSEGETASLYVSPITAVISQGRIIGNDGKDGVVLLASNSNNVSASVLWNARISLDPILAGHEAPDVQDFLIEVRRGEIASLIDVVKETSRVHNIALFNDAIAEAAAKFWERVEAGEFRGNQGPPGPAGVGIGVPGPAGKAGVRGKDGAPGLGGNMLPDGDLEEPGFLVRGDYAESADSYSGSKSVRLSNAVSRKIPIEPDKAYAGNFVVKADQAVPVKYSLRVFGNEGDIDRVIENTGTTNVDSWRTLSFLIDTKKGDQSVEIIIETDGRIINVDYFSFIDSTELKGIQTHITNTRADLLEALEKVSNDLTIVDSERERLNDSLNDLAAVLENADVDLTEVNEELDSLRRELEAKQLSTGTNIIPNGEFLKDSSSWDGTAEVSRVEVSDLDGIPWALTSTSTVTNPYSGEPFQVRTDTSYVFDFWIKADKVGSVFYLGLKDQSGADAIDPSTYKVVQGPETLDPQYLVGGLEVPSSWTMVQVTFKVKPDVYSVSPTPFHFNHESGEVTDAQVWVTALSLRARMNDVLIEEGSITSRHILANSIGTDQLIANSITADKIGANQITVDKMAANSIGTDQLIANSIDADKIAANAITAHHIASKTITADEIAANTIQADNLSAESLTVIGRTVVNDINIAGKLIGVDGVFTGTVDFDNVIVTGTQLVNKLGATSITADMINGGSFTGETFEGGTFTGGKFETSDNLQGRVTMSDTSGKWSNQTIPGIEIEPIATTGYKEFPYIGPDSDGMIVHGGTATSGQSSGARLSKNLSSLFFHGPPLTSGGRASSYVQGYSSGAYLTYVPDNVGKPGDRSDVSANSLGCSLTTDRGDISTEIEAAFREASMAVKDGAGTTAEVQSHLDAGARLEFRSKTAKSMIIATENYAWIAREERGADGIYTRRDRLELERRGLTFSQSVRNPDGTSTFKETLFDSTEWLPVRTFGTGWSLPTGNVASWAPMHYRRVMDTVWVNGYLKKSSNATVGETMCYLPFTPKRFFDMPGRGQIDPQGRVLCPEGNTTVVAVSFSFPLG